MESISRGPLRVASLVWRRGEGAWIHTTVVRATFDLVPGVSVLAKDQEEPNVEDEHWNDDPSRSVVRPSDLAPWKEGADVVLVGHAFAPGSELVRGLVARLCVGSIDKSIEVGDGAPFNRRSLRWECVGGAGFGPLAPSSPERRALLRGRELSLAALRVAPPTDLDPSFFNVAPLDQRLSELRADEQIELENLHPELAKLTTSLPGIAPVGVVERRSGSEPLTFTCDTLWIDTDRARAALTWRASIALDREDEPGRVLVDVAQADGPRAARTQSSIRRRATTLVGAVAPSEVLPFVAVASGSGSGPITPSWPRELDPAPLPFASFRAPPPAPLPRLAHDGAAVHDGLAAVSDAAALREPRPRLARAVPKESERLRERVELLGYEPVIGPKVRLSHHLKDLSAKDSSAPAAWRTDAAKLVDEAARERREVMRALANAPALGEAELTIAMDEALLEGEVALVKVAGELSLAFDELETLRAWVGAARGLAPLERRVIDAADAAERALAMPSRLPTEVLEAHVATLRAALGQGPRPSDQTHAQLLVERHLLEQRSFRYRHVLGARRLRASLSLGGRHALPVYVPDSIANELPLFARFGARLVAELKAPQEPGEATLSLLLVALGRAV